MPIYYQLSKLPSPALCGSCQLRRYQQGEISRSRLQPSRYSCMKFCYLIVTTLLASTVWLTAPMTIFNSKLYHQTYVAGISVSIPTSLVTLQEGRHAVKVGDVEIGVALIRQNNDVIGPEFEISSPVPESKLRTEIPISELLAEVMIYASLLRKDVKISLDSTKA